MGTGQEKETNPLPLLLLSLAEPAAWQEQAEESPVAVPTEMTKMGLGCVCHYIPSGSTSGWAGYQKLLSNR